MIIAFEGIDGSGKSTLAEMFVKLLRQKDVCVAETRPSGEEKSRVANQIRNITRDSSNIPLEPVPEYLLFLARYLQQTHEVGEKKADVIIADRSLFTPVLMAVAREALTFDEAMKIAGQCARDLPWPDLIVLINVDIETSRIRKRLKKIGEKRLGEGRRKGTAGLGLRVRLHRALLDLAGRYPDKFIVIDNNAPLLEPAFEKLCAELLPRLGIREKLKSSGKHYNSPAWKTVDEISDQFYGKVDELKDISPGLSALCLKGLNSPTAWRLRKDLMNDAMEVVAYSLSGLESPEARRMRRDLSMKVPYYVMHSLPARLDSEEDIQLRKDLLEVSPYEVGLTLKRQDTDWAWELRDRLTKISMPGALVSLTWQDSERAWEIRLNASKKERAYLLRGLNGLDSDAAWDLRMRYIRRFPMETIRSTSGMISQRAYALRDRFIERAPDTVMKSLPNVHDDASMEMRRKAARHSRVAVGGLFECDDEAAWELREEYISLWPVAAVASLGSLWNTDRGLALITKALEAAPGSLKLARAVTRYVENNNE